MKTYLFHIFTILLIINHINFTNGHEDEIPSTMCPRYSVNEFYLSIFKPLFHTRMNFVENLLKVSSDAIEEMLVKVEQKKGNDGSVSKQALNSIRFDGMKVINKARFEYEQV